MDEFYHNMMKQYFGRQKGRLWRSDREWFAYANDPVGEINETKKYVEERRKGLYDDKGFTRKRLGRWMGSVPPSVFWANPQLATDPDEARRFFKDFPAFSSKGR